MNNRKFLIYLSTFTLLITTVKSADNECLKTAGPYKYCVKCHEEKHYFAFPLQTYCSCENGYVEKEDSNGNKLCVSRGCNTFTDDGKCTGCDPTYYKLVNDKCVRICDGAKGVGENDVCFDCPKFARSCALYQNKNFITECIYGYGPTLDQLECKKCKNGCSSCIFYGNTEVCKSCFVENEGCYGNKCRRAIKTEDYTGYTLECSAKYLAASGLAILLFLF